MGVIAVAVAVTGSACGSGTPPPKTAAPVRELEAGAYLRLYATEEVESLALPTDSLEELDERRKAASGGDRIQATRALVVALMWEADSAAEADDKRTAARHRRRADQLARNLSRRVRDDLIRADMDFARLWMAWRAARPNAQSLAERFTSQHLRSGSLLMMAWLIRGELAFAQKRWNDASAAYRYVVAQIDHPLYGFALFRTAHCLHKQKREEDAEQALREVVALGCSGDSVAHVDKVVAAAAGQLGVPIRVGPDGARRPASCRTATPPE